MPGLIQRRHQSSDFFDRFSDLVVDCVVKHVPSARNQPQGTLRNLRVKSTRLLAEAMVARGHDVTIAYPRSGAPWPSPLHVGRFAKRAVKALRALAEDHHLETSTARLVPVAGREVLPRHVPAEGRLAGEVNPARATIEAIGLLMTGGGRGGTA